MNRAFILVPAAALLFLGARVARADAPDEATPRDLERLQDDLVNLDDDLHGFESGGGRAQEFERRADEIREDATYLKVKMRRHQEGGVEGTGVLLDEVDRLRQGIRNLRDDIAAAFRQDVQELRIPGGEDLLVRLEDPVSSKTARPEDRFDATVVEPVRVDHYMVIPAGTRVRGIVRHVQPAEQPSRPGNLDLEFDRLFLEQAAVDIRAYLVAVGGQRSTGTKAGLGAILGGMIGGILGGRGGVFVGAVMGSTGAVVATKGDDVNLPAGALLTIRLRSDVMVPAPRRY